MSLCNGNGKCIFQCECECYNEETGEYDEICICTHREHNGNCQSNCCKPLECKNYKYCKVIQPKWISDYYNGMCMDCAIQQKKHIFTNKIEKCCLCLEEKTTVILQCGHALCNDCSTNKGLASDNCPLCNILNDLCN